MKNKSIIFNIQNKNNIKLVFSYLDYQYILKLIKKNKRLQKILGIELENYKNKSNPKYILEKKEDSMKFQLPFTGLLFKPNRSKKIFFLFYLLFSTYFFLFTIYILIYIILLISIEIFNKKNIKENYEEKFKIIKIIDLSLFTFLIIIFFEYYLFIYHMVWEYLIKKILSIFFILINFLFEILVIWKLVLSFQIKKDKVIWLMIMDFIFILLNIIYNLSFIYGVYIYFYYYIIPHKKFINEHTFYCITTFDNIKINNYKVSKDFLKMKQREKTQFLLNNYKNMEYINSKDEKNLIILINEYREQNNLPILKFSNNLKLSDYMITESSEIMINPDQNLFFEDNKRYLFKYPVGEFENEFKKKNSNIFDTLQKENLNFIQIFTKDKYEFIYICELPINNNLI